MKIAMIGQKGIPTKGGGIEKHVEELAIRLVKAGHDVYVYTRPNYTDKKLKRYRGVKLVSLPTIASKHLDAISHTFLACLDVIFRKKYDYVHFHAIGPASLILFVKIFKPNLPIVFTFHCQDYFHQKWGVLAKAYLKIGEYIGCKLANEVIAVSKEIKKYAEKKYQREINYIPNGVSLPKIIKANEIRKHWALNGNDYILSVSRLIRHKGLHYLIKAYNEIKTSKKLVIVGDGAYTTDYIKELKDLAKDNPKVIFTGNQTGRVLEELYSNAFLFVQPSEYEGLSFSLLEAMSYGLPIVVSSIPENKEPVGKSAIVFKNKNYKDLKNKLQFSLKHQRQNKNIGIKAKERVREFYNLYDITKATLKIYKAILTK